MIMALAVAGMAAGPALRLMRFLCDPLMKRQMPRHRLSVTVAAIVTLLDIALAFPIAFFSSFYIPTQALWWGAAMGAGTAFAGAILPAWSAQNVKAAEVFAKVG